MTDDENAKPRRPNRSAMDFAVEVYDADGKTLRAISRLSDLSVAGACLASTTDMGETDSFVLRVMLGRRTVIEVPARVVWKRYFSKTFQYGLQFPEYPDNVRQAITDFVNRKPNDPARVGIEDIGDQGGRP